MDSQINLPPGTRVRTARGIIGAVERVEPGAGGPLASHGTVFVRSEDQRFRYAFPLEIVSDAGELGGAHYAQIAIDDLDLSSYVQSNQAVPDQAPAGRVDNQRNQSAAAPQINTLQGDTLAIPLAQEQIITETQPIQLGTLHVRKTVETLPQRVAVAVAHEHATIQRIPADQFDPKLQSDPNLIVIPIVEERLVVQVQPVVTEYICIRKDRTTEMQEVHETVRREVLTVTQDAAADAPPLFDVQGLDVQAAQG